MDYEKAAYKDALEKARFLRQQAVAGGNPLMANRYEQIFPELAESEDEKTAKEIEDFILYKAGHLLDEATEHRFVKYLERQKECLADNSKTSDSEDERIRKGLSKFLWDVANGEVKSMPSASQCQEWLSYLEEQKPGTTEDNPIVPFDTKLFQDGVEVGRRLEREDMQKPAEWSEEDEEIIYSLRSFLIQAEQSGRYGSIQIAQIEQCLNWLKSLRPQPHWKPSEEQMGAFRSYIKDFQEKAEAAVGGWNNFDVMIRLYEHLKNLM